MEQTNQSQGVSEASVFAAEALTAKALIAKCETDLASYSGYLEFHRERCEYLSGVIAKAEVVGSPRRMCWTWTARRSRFYGEQEQKALRVCLLSFAAAQSRR